MAATTNAHALGLMRLVRLASVGNTDTRAPGLDVRQQLVIQALGLDGPMPLHTLADQLALSPSTMTGIADRLEQAGFARREHAQDRRVTLLQLTPAGEQVFAKEVDWFGFIVSGTLEQLTPRSARAVSDALASFAHPSHS